MIIEFNGLPGTGKTTVCKALANRISGKRPVSLRHFPKESRLKRYVSYFTDGSRTLYRLGVRYSDSLYAGDGDTDVAARKKNRDLAFRLVKYYQSYRSFYRKASGDAVLLLDEGIIHTLLTVAHGRSITSAEHVDAIFRFLKKKGIEFIGINCLSDTSLSNSRISERGDTGARLDVCDEEERARVLSVQKANLELLRERAAEILAPRTVIVDTARGVDENAAFIDDELKLSGN